MQVIEHPPAIARRNLTRWLIASGVLIAILASTGFYFVSKHWPYRYRVIKPLLEDDFGSEVTITRYHRTYYPHPGFVAMGVRLHRRSAPHAPDLGYAESMVVQGTWAHLFTLQRRVERVEVAGLHITIPTAGSRAMAEDFPPGSGSDFTGPETRIDQFIVHDAVLEIEGKDGGSLLFPIHQLTLHRLEKDQPLTYAVAMRNPKPSGEIHASGSFGPLSPRDISSTPVSGEFEFTGVRLADVGGIRGMLTSSGSFRGPLGAIEAKAMAHVPDFAVSQGRTTPMDGSIECTVDGLHGDLEIRAIEVKTGATTIRATGTIAGTPNATNLDIDVRHGRAEDLLRPFIHDDVPIEGAVWLKAHAYLAPAGNGQEFLRRLHVVGSFDVPAEKLTDSKTEKSLTDFSHRAEVHKQAESVGTSDNRDVLSSVHGPARIEGGVASSKNIYFSIPGADATLRGTFNFEDKSTHMVGDLRMQTDISHTATGFKSFLLKPLAPFFKKKHAGAVIPIAVLGSPGHYQVTQDLGHSK